MPEKARRPAAATAARLNLRMVSLSFVFVMVCTPGGVLSGGAWGGGFGGAVGGRGRSEMGERRVQHGPARGGRRCPGGAETLSVSEHPRTLDSPSQLNPPFQVVKIVCYRAIANCGHSGAARRAERRDRGVKARVRREAGHIRPGRRGEENAGARVRRCMRVIEA